MDSILRIIKYLFKEKSIVNDDESIESFFENGISFPSFISMIFGADEIPGIIKAPKTIFHKKINNDKAIQFLFQNNEYIRKVNPSYETYKDKINLLSMILTKQCFIINEQKIIQKCNLIVKPLGKFFSNQKDFVKISNLFTLLNVLTDGTIQTVSDDQDDIDTLLKNCFEKVDVPLVVDSNSVNIHNCYQFFIQIEIIFRSFSEKINKIESNSFDAKEIQMENQSESTKKEDSKKMKKEKHSKSKRSDKNVFTNKKETNKMKEMSKEVEENKNEININVKDKNKNDKESMNEEEKDTNNIKIKEEMLNENEENKEDENKNGLNFNKEALNEKGKNKDAKEEMLKENEENVLNEKETSEKNKSNQQQKKLNKNHNKSEKFIRENIKEEGLLSTINAIGSKGGFHFKNFYEAIKNDSIPKFVLFFLDIKSIENVHINKSNTKSYLTKDEINNIKGVIEYLKKKKVDNFDFFQFNFQNETEIEEASIFFYSTFINFFFIKHSREEMYKRCTLLFYNHYNFTDMNKDFQKLGLNVFVALLNFLKKGSIRLDFKFSKKILSDTEAQRYFEDAKVPIIIKSAFFEIEWDVIPNMYFYQLQFIFDALENASKSRKIAEGLINAIYKFKSIHVPDFKKIKINMKSKQYFLEYQKRKQNSYLNRNDDIQNSSYENENLNISKPKTFKERQQKSFQLNETKNNSKVEKFESFESFWKYPKDEYVYKNGIIIEKNKTQPPEMKTNWENEMINIQNSMNSNKPNNNQRSFLFAKTKNKTESKLYKLFYYDESNKTWRFDSNVFQQFTQEKYLNDLKISLILYLNSNENDLISLNSNLIKGSFPKLDEDQIYIYALCDQPISMLNFQIDFVNSFKNSIKPIFLLLHVPKKYENHPDIEIIIYQIYSFLLLICRIKIVILNKENYFNQITFMRSIRTVNQSFVNDQNYIFKKCLNSNCIGDDDIFDINENEFIDEIDESEEIKNNDKKNNEIDVFNYLNYRKPEFILLINDSNIEFDDKICDIISKNQFFLDIKEQFIESNSMQYINVNNSNTYENFLITLNKFVLYYYPEFSTLEAQFKTLEFYLKESCPIFFYLKSKCDVFPEKLKNLVHERYSMYKNSNEHGNESSFSILYEIQKELLKISPSYDDDFLSECNLFISELMKDASTKYRDFLQNELKISADSHITFLNDYLNSQYFWVKNHVNIIINTHFKYLEDEFFSIIQSFISEDYYTIFYQKSIDILENQKRSGRNKIFEMFDSYFKNRNKQIVQDIQECKEKEANYVLKETENIREVKVTVQIGKDLQSEIRQDF